jgi:drug/metabolite transporter (DMT)-like permease
MALNARTALILLVPPLMWAANALLGHVLASSVPPLQLNAMRWACALLLLLPLGWRVFGTAQRRQEVLQRWRPLALLGLSGIGIYNALQYLALHTSSPVNVAALLVDAGLCQIRASPVAARATVHRPNAWR